MAIPFPDIDPIAIAIGPVEIRWYALAYLAGFLLGWRYAVYLAKRYKDTRLNADTVDDFLAWAVFGVILGGRVGYVLFYQLGYYLEHPAEVLKVWQGGMSFHGGMLGVIVAMVLYCRVKHLPLLKFTDIICCVAPIGLFFGRIANFINGELFGRPTEAAIGVLFPRGGGVPRHPSQLYEAILEGAVLFVILYLLSSKETVRDRAGILSGVFLAGYGMFRAFIELFREPDVQIGYIAGIFTMGQVLCVPMVLGGLYLIYYGYLKSGHGHNVAS